MLASGGVAAVFSVVRSEQRQRRAEAKHAPRLALSVMLAAAGSLAACAPSGTDAVPPNLILVSLDTTRADYCSLYGFPHPTTPVLDDLAEAGLAFDSAIAPSTWTLPSHASLWTGLYPREHGTVSSLSADGGEYGRPLPRELPSLPRLLQHAGYQTAGFVGGPFLTRGFGFHLGFETFDDDLGDLGRSGPELNRRALEWLRTRREARPLFLFVNYYDAHRPYAPPQDLEDPFEAPGRCQNPEPRDFDPVTSGTLSGAVEIECARMQYAREIRAADRALGELLGFLEERGELERAVVAVVGDHGESFGENRAWAHGGPGFLQQRRVPLVIAQTGRRSQPARRVPGAVSITRLPRTLLEAAGLEAPATWLGPSLLSPDGAELPPLTERFTRETHYYTVTLPDWSYFVIERPDGRIEEQYFRVSQGVEEFNTERGADVVALAEASWAALQERLGPVPRFAERPRPTQEEVLRQLRELGYAR